VFSIDAVCDGYTSSTVYDGPPSPRGEGDFPEHTKQNRGRCLGFLFLIKLFNNPKITYYIFSYIAKDIVEETNLIKPCKSKKEIFEMARNKISVPEAKEAMNKFKMEAANEVGVNLKNGYNGDLTSKQAGSVGGQMVKKMIESAEKNMK
jgi:hypothetical protein